MRAARTSHRRRFSAFSFAVLVSITACTTEGPSSKVATDDSQYDGVTDTMDSLPDCIPEMAGSSFWVREKKGAFDCISTGEWKNRRAAVVPDDAEEEVPGAWTPRLIEK